MSIEFTDRYLALGIPYPDVETMCEGPCEGTGWVPIKDGEQDVRYKAAWDATHAAVHDEPCDGWHFVKCLDCSGSGKRGS